MRWKCMSFTDELTQSGYKSTLGRLLLLPGMDWLKPMTRLCENRCHPSGICHSLFAYFIIIVSSLRCLWNDIFMRTVHAISLMFICRPSPKGWHDYRVKLSSNVQSRRDGRNWIIKRLHTECRERRSSGTRWNLAKVFNLRKVYSNYFINVIFRACVNPLVFSI